MTLPVGLDVTARRVVVVGGGPESAYGVSTLLAAGALVEVVAPYVCEDLAVLVASGEVAWAPRDYEGRQDLDGAWLVHTATGDREVDDAVRADALDLRVWCLAPTAAHATAHLPATTSVAAGDVTLTVAAQAGSDHALATAVVREVGAVLASGSIDLRRRTPRAGAGWVALVGGGPGADGLLTTRARELLSVADVVVVDRLAPRGVVD
ncbi:MAG TPA: NAD(P)-dependent oxidoreductase, partial [Ornithinibacter sp.]|nr:NAD(P)-dependent oxidoreductase [Ornithinibacter sp.]